MPPSTRRVATAYSARQFLNLSAESKRLIFGSFLFYLRDRANSRGSVVVGPDLRRPKEVRFKLEPDGRVKITDFPDPDVAWIEYDPESNVVRVTSKSGRALETERTDARFGYSTSELKAAGKALADAGVSALGRLRQEWFERNPPPAKSPAPQVEPEAWQKSPPLHTWSLDAEAVQDALRKVGVKTSISPGYAMGRKYLERYPEYVGIVWGQRGREVYWFLSKANSAADLPGNRADYQGSFVLNADPLTPLVREIKAALDKLDRARAKAQAEEEARAKAQAEEVSEEGGVWSVAQTGYEVGGDAEEEYQGYVAEVWTFRSKDKAIAKARALGGAAVMRGTQMENEPLGQIEESDRDAAYRYYR